MKSTVYEFVLGDKEDYLSMCTRYMYTYQQNHVDLISHFDFLAMSGLFDYRFYLFYDYLLAQNARLLLLQN